jgi:hypothetical protein
MKLSPAQRGILERQGVWGEVIRYETRWVVEGQRVTGTVNSLLRRGLMSATYYRRNQCAATITASGRKALGEN